MTHLYRHSCVGAPASRDKLASIGIRTTVCGPLANTLDLARRLDELAAEAFRVSAREGRHYTGRGGRYAHLPAWKTIHMAARFKVLEAPNAVVRCWVTARLAQGTVATEKLASQVRKGKAAGRWCGRFPSVCPRKRALSNPYPPASLSLVCTPRM
jgi:hypothetical protein